MSARASSHGRPSSSAGRPSSSAGRPSYDAVGKRPSQEGKRASHEASRPPSGPRPERARPASSRGTPSSPTVLAASTDTRWFGYKDIATLCARTMEERFPLPAPEIDDSASDTLIELSSSGCHINRGEDDEDAGNAFAEWVAYVLYRTVLPMHTVFHALHLIVRLSGLVAAGEPLPQTLNPPPPAQADGKSPPPRRNQLHYRLFLSALILCTTYSMDDAYANKSWAIASKFVFDIKSINRMEFDLFRALDWRLAAEGEHITEVVKTYQAEWEAGLKQQARLRAQREQERKRQELCRLNSDHTVAPTSQPSPSGSAGRTSVPPSPASVSRPTLSRAASSDVSMTPSFSRTASSSLTSTRTRTRTDSASLSLSRTETSETSTGPPATARPESRASSRGRSLSAGIRGAFSLFRSASRERSRDRGSGERDGSKSRWSKTAPSPGSARPAAPPRRSSEDKGKGRELPEPPARQRRTSNEARWLGFTIGAITRRPLPRPPTSVAVPAAAGPVSDTPCQRTTTAPEPTAAAAAPAEAAVDTTPRPSAQWARPRAMRSKPPVALRRMTSQPCMATRSFPLAAAG